MSSIPNKAATDAAGVRAFPIAEAFERLGVSPFTGHKLINQGELTTFLIGARRYITNEALQAFVNKQIQRAATTDTPAVRMAKVKAAVKGRQRQRERAAA